jgi:hypothetical protein
VSDTVVEVLEFVEEPRPSPDVEAEFSPAVVDSLVERGVLARGE